MSIVIAFIRKDYICFLTDTRLYNPIANLVITESSQKVYRLSDSAILATAGGHADGCIIAQLTMEEVSARLQTYDRNSIDYVSVVCNAIEFTKQDDPLFAPAIIWLGVKENSKMNLYSFITNRSGVLAEYSGNDNTEVIVMPPSGMSRDEVGREIHSKLHQANTTLETAQLDQLLDACTKAIHELSLRNPYINNICQHQVITLET